MMIQTLQVNAVYTNETSTMQQGKPPGVEIEESQPKQ